MMDRADSPWIMRFKARGVAQQRLFLFPHAGAGAPAYRNWPALLPVEIEPCVIQPPGRGMRLAEKPFTRVGPLVQAAAQAILPYLDRPFRFFGHSLGAIIAFELARELRSQGAPLPQQLIVSGRAAPQLPDPDPPMHNLPHDELIARLRRFNGTPPEILDTPQLLEIFLPVLRADLEVNESYQYQTQTPLAVPLLAMGGWQDHRTNEASLRAWGEHSSHDFRLKMFPGDHFYLFSQEAEFLSHLARELLP